MNIFFFSCLELIRQFDWDAYFENPQSPKNGNESLTEEYDTNASEVSTSASPIISNSESSQSCGSYLDNKEISTVGDGTNANSVHYITDEEFANTSEPVADDLHDNDLSDIFIKLEDECVYSFQLNEFLHSNTDETSAKLDKDIQDNLAGNAADNISMSNESEATLQLNLGTTSNSLNGTFLWYTEHDDTDQYNGLNLLSEVACLFANN